MPNHNGRAQEFERKIIKNPLFIWCSICDPANKDVFDRTTEQDRMKILEQRLFCKSGGDDNKVTLNCGLCGKLMEANKEEKRKREQLIKSFTTTRKVVECWRIYSTPDNNDNNPMLVSASQSSRHNTNNDLEKGMKKLMNEIDCGTYENRAFLISSQSHKFNVLYIVEVVTSNPDGGYIVTLSAGFYHEDKHWKDTLSKSLYAQDFNVRLIHKMIPVESIEKGIHSLLGNVHNIQTEVAANHHQLFFSRMDSVYCGWDSGSGDFPRRTTYKFLPPYKVIELKQGSKYYYNNENIITNDGNYEKIEVILNHDCIIWYEKDFIYSNTWKCTNALVCEIMGGNNAQRTYTWKTFEKLFITKQESGILPIGEALIGGSIHILHGKTDSHHNDEHCANNIAALNNQNSPANNQNSPDSPADNANDHGKSSIVNCQAMHDCDKSFDYHVNTPNTDRPLILIVWNNPLNKCESHFLCLYNLLTRQLLDCKSIYNLPLPRNPNHHNETITKIARLTSRYVPNIQEPTQSGKYEVYLGIERYNAKGVICGSYVGTCEIENLYNQPLLSDITMHGTRLHDHRLTALEITVSQKLCTGSIGKSMSVTKFNGKQNSIRDSTIETISSITTDTILSVMPTEIDDALFTSSSDATIRYWRRIDNNIWTSYLFPVDHVKRVSCLAYRVMFPIQSDEHVEKPIVVDDNEVDPNDPSPPISRQSTMAPPQPRREDDYTGRAYDCMLLTARTTMQLITSLSTAIANHDYAAVVGEITDVLSHSANVKRNLIPSKVLVSGSLDHRIIVWDVTNPVKPVIVKYLIGHEDEVISLKIIQHPIPSVISAGRDKTIRFWDLLNGNCFRMLNHSSMINELDMICIVRKNDDKLDLKHTTECNLGEIVAISSEQGIVCWNFLSNHRMNVQHSDPVISMVADNDNNLVYFGTNISQLVVSNDSLRKNQLLLNEKHKYEKVRVHVLLLIELTINGKEEKGKYIIAAMANGFISIVDIVNMKELLCFNTTMQSVNSLVHYDPTLPITTALPSPVKASRNSSNPLSTLSTDNSGGNVESKRLLFIGGTPDTNGNTLQIWDLKLMIETYYNYHENHDEVDDWYDILVDNSAKYVTDKLQGSPITCLTTQHICNTTNGNLKYGVLITVDHSRNVIVWKITPDNTLVKLLNLEGLHTSHSISHIEMFNPLQKWNIAAINKKGKDKELSIKWSIDYLDEHKIQAFESYDLKQCEMIITGGHDGMIGLWPIPYDKLDEANDLSEGNDSITHYRKLQHDNLQGVTAMIIFFPKGGENINPLLITGSIDSFIYVWDIFTLEKLRVLTCHSNRVNALTTYYSDNQTTILVSGSDDGSIVFWKDGLQHHTFPPAKHTIIRSFYNDILTPCGWQHIKALKATCNGLFWEFPQLFYLALIERQETFFIEFIDDLKQVITRIPAYERSDEGKSRWIHHVAKGKVDILEYAMHSNSLIALKAILLAWSYVLNKDIEDSLNQNMLYTTRIFNEKNLLELATSFPVEYTDFISSLRLIRAHRSAGSVNNKLIRIIPHGKRMIVIGSNSFPLDDNFKTIISSKLSTPKEILTSFIGFFKQQPTWEQFSTTFIQTWKIILEKSSELFSNIYYKWTDFKVIVVNGREIHEQAIMPFMIPIKRFVDLRHFYGALQSSELIKSLDIFESDVMMAAIQHFWNAYGWKVYGIILFQYSLTIFMFVYSIYTYQSVTLMSKPDDLSLSRCQTAAGGFMFFMTWYAFDEFFQVVGKFAKFHRHNISKGRFFHILINHFVMDMWNVIDCTVIVTGFFGSYGLYQELEYCYSESRYYDPNGAALSYCDVPGKGSSTTSCLLAATAVLLWFKVLYYLRPIKAAGQFVAMVMIIMNDIKYFLFVLICVLIGFAQGFWLLLNDADPSSHFTEVRQSYFTTFMFMLGQISEDEIDNSKSSTFTKVFLVAFMITMMILLFNLLIALMGDSFDRTKKNIEALYWKELVSFMVDQSMPTPLLGLLHLTGIMSYEKDDFVHVVKYASDVKVTTDKFSDDDTNAGQVGQDLSPLEKSFNSSAQLVLSNMSDRQELRLTKKSFVDNDIIDRTNLKKSFKVTTMQQSSSAINPAAASGSSTNTTRPVSTAISKPPQQAHQAQRTALRVDTSHQDPHVTLATSSNTTSSATTPVNLTTPVKQEGKESEIDSTVSPHENPMRSNSFH